MRVARVVVQKISSELPLKVGPKSMPTCTRDKVLDCDAYHTGGSVLFFTVS
jgi:hypothetical protein